MTNDMMNLRSLVEKSADADWLREMIGFAAEKLMALEVGTKTCAGYGEKNGFRLAQRNGYRDRDWETRAPDIHDITPIVEEMEMLREEVLNLLEVRINVQNMHGNEFHTKRHIQNSKPESSSDLEPASNMKQSETSAIQQQALDMPMGYTAAGDESGERISVTDGRLVKPRTTAVAGGDQPGLKAFPLELVLQACPEILSYGPGRSIGSWRDLMAAAVVVRSMLGVSSSAYEEACTIMGPENAATVMACVLERAGSITSAGGYLRDLTRRTERGEFAIGPMLMSLARANAGRREQTG